MFERDLGDGWKCEKTVDGIGVWNADGMLKGYTERGDVVLVDGVPGFPARVMVRFLDAYREWSLQQPEGSPDRVEWERAT